MTTVRLNRSKTGLIIPTDDEDAAINRGIAADPDTVAITAELAAKMRPFRHRQPPAPRTGPPRIWLSMKHGQEEDDGQGKK